MNCAVFKNISSMSDKAPCSSKSSQKIALNIYSNLFFVSCSVAGKADI